jgi:hypothetical protein
MKTVYMPIEVPDSDYCWKKCSNEESCKHSLNVFEIDGSPCDLGFHPIIKNDGAQKDPKCAALGYPN